MTKLDPSMNILVFIAILFERSKSFFGAIYSALNHRIDLVKIPSLTAIDNGVGNLI